MSKADDLAKRVKSLTQRKVVLPILGIEVEVRAFSSRTMLNAGVLPLIQFEPEELDPSEAESKADEFLSICRDLLISQAIKPKFVFGETDKENEVSVDSVPDADLTAVFYQALSVSNELYYGTNRKAYIIEQHERLAKRQEEVTLIIDAVCRRYSIPPYELTKLSESELRETIAICQLGLEKEKQAIEEAKNG